MYVKCTVRRRCRFELDRCMFRAVHWGGNLEPGGGGGARNREVGWAARAHVRLASKCV